MRTIGLIGGMSWHSTMTYYRIINEAVAARLGGHSSADLVLRSVDFEEVRRQQLADDWPAAGDRLAAAARDCVRAGAETVAICTNLMHKVAPVVEAAVDVPLLHIADAVGGVAVEHGWTKVGLLGARWVMEKDFYAERLARHGVEVLTPDAADREVVDRVIFDELTLGRIEETSRKEYVEITSGLAERGARAVVLACTEIGLLLDDESSPLPTIDSAQAHAEALAAWSLARTGPARSGDVTGRTSVHAP